MKKLLIALILMTSAAAYAQPIISAATNPIFKKNLIIMDSLTVGDLANDPSMNRIVVWDSLTNKFDYRQVTTLPTGGGTDTANFAADLYGLDSIKVLYGSATGNVEQDNDFYFKPYLNRVYVPKLNLNAVTIDNTQGRILVVDSVNGDVNYRNVSTITSATDLSFTGASSPVTLNSSTGTDVTITAGTNITLAGTSGNLSINSPDYSGTFLKLDQTTPQTVINGAPNFGGGIMLNDGNAATPSLSFTGDTDNGMYLSGTNEVSFATGGSQRMVIDASGNFITGGTTQTFRVNNSNGFLTSGIFTGFVGMGGYDGSSFATNALALAIRSNASSTAIYSFYLLPTNTRSNTTGTSGLLTGVVNYSPTSGTGVFNTLNLSPQINQTGGANGKTRGVYINPTLTSAAGWLALESTAGKFLITDGYSAGSGSLAGTTLDIAPTWNTSGTPTAIKLNVTNTASNSASKLLDLQVGSVSKYSIGLNGKQTFEYTYTAGGTTGAQTIDKVSGSVNFAAAATSLVVTNARVTTSSIVFCQVMTNDATMKSVQVVVGSGSFTLYSNAAATSETKVGFFVIN